MRKFIRRHRVGVTAAALVLVAVLLGAATSTVGFIQASHEREIAQANADEASTEAARANAVVDLMKQMLSSADPHQTKGPDYTVRELLDEFAAGVTDQLRDQPEVEATLRSIVGNAYRNLGELDRAEPHLARALEIRRRALGDEHELVFQSQGDWAWLRHDRGEYAEAEEILRQVIARRGNRLDDTDALAASSVANLSDFLRHQGEYAEAETLAREAIEIYQRVLGEEHPNTLGAMHILANLYHSQGRYADAEQLYLRTLKIKRRLFGEEHPRTLRSMNNLANVYKDLGRYADAEPLNLRTLEIRRRVLGEEHPLTLGSMTNFANLRRAQGRLQEAELLYAESLAAKRRILGIGHQWTRSAMEGLAKVYERTGRSDDAVPLRAELLDYRVERATRDDADAWTKNDTAWDLLTHDYEQLRDPQTALQLALEAVRMRGHLDPASLDTLALAYHMTGENAAAVETQRRAIELLDDDDEARAELEGRLAEFEAAMEMAMDASAD